MKEQILKILIDEGFKNHERHYLQPNGYIDENGAGECDTILEILNNQDFAEFIAGKLAGNCSCACLFQMPYGFVPEADCPVHDSYTLTKK